MADNKTQRKLTAILSADVKGYSKLMGDDDESTVNTITTYRKVISDLVDKHQGRVVDTPGDNILVKMQTHIGYLAMYICLEDNMIKPSWRFRRPLSWNLIRPNANLPMA